MCTHWVSVQLNGSEPDAAYGIKLSVLLCFINVYGGVFIGEDVFRAVP